MERLKIKGSKLLEAAGIKREVKQSSAITKESFNEILKERLMKNLTKEIEQPVMRNWGGYATSGISSFTTFTSVLSSSSYFPMGGFPYEDVQNEPRMIKPKVMNQIKMKPISLEPKRNFSFD